MDIERSKQGSKEANLLPVINVVFLLLIFFLVTGTIEKFDIIPVEVPVADSGKILDAGHIVVVLGQYDEVIVNDELIDISELEPRVKAMLENNPRKIISLKADSRMEAERMITVMNRLREAGGENLSIVTQSLN
jgi:biopolymer transport protein ExbD